MVWLVQVRRYLTPNDKSAKEPTTLRTFVKTCDPVRPIQDAEESTCANITIIAGRVHDDTRHVHMNVMHLTKLTILCCRYDVYMEKGVKYSAHHGALRKEMSVSFGGLRPFKLPFYLSRRSLSTKLFDIWLPHGTGVEQDIFDIPIVLTDKENGTEVDSQDDQT